MLIYLGASIPSHNGIYLSENMYAMELLMSVVDINWQYLNFFLCKRKGIRGGLSIRHSRHVPRDCTPSSFPSAVQQAVVPSGYASGTLAQFPILK